MSYSLQIQDQVFYTVFVKSTKVLLMWPDLFAPHCQQKEPLLINSQKFLYHFLEPLTYNQYIIKDSFSFCEELKHFNTNLIMASSDVGALFTNIPLQETIELCVQKLFEHKNYIDG